MQIRGVKERTVLESKDGKVQVRIRGKGKGKGEDVGKEKV